jgi:hypothetical protein
MITKEQYEAAKKIVDQYEYEEYLAGMLEAEEEDDYDENDDWQERQDEEDYERACSCTCGAWVVGKDGRGYHVADCFCGAD